MKKILSDKKYLALIAGAAVLVVAAIILVCVLSCGGAAGKNGGKSGKDAPLFEFETTLEEEGSVIENYPVTCISATDFYKLLEAENSFSIGQFFDDSFEAYGAKLHFITEVNISGTDFMSSRSGMYLEKGNNVYDINYTNCDFYEYDIDGDGEIELIFYNCEIGENGVNHICTYFVLGTEPDDIYWCRYNRAWAVGPSSEVDLAADELSKTDISQVTATAENEEFLVSLMLQGVGYEVYGQLECDNSGEEPFYYIDAGEFNDLLQRVDGLDVEEEVVE